MRRLGLALVLLALLAPSARAQKSPADAGPRDSTEDLAAACLSARGALSADLLLTLVESGKVPSAERRRELIDAALVRAEASTERVRVVLIANRDVDTRSGYRSNALESHPVDLLSLRCRAIDCLLDIDPPAARSALEQTAPGLGLAGTDCASVLVPDPSRFYATLVRVADRSFTKRERGEGLHAVLLARYIGGAASPVEIAPAAEAILKADLRAAARSELIGVLSTAIERMEASDRELVAVVGAPGALESLETLATTARSQDGLARRFARALRALVLRTLRSSRCRDTTPTAGELATGVIAELNGGPLATDPITTDDLGVPTFGAAPADEPFWRSTASRDALGGFQSLRQAREEMEPGASLVAWRLDYQRLMDRIRAWRVEDEADEIDYLSEKCILYAGIATIAPDLETSADTTREFLKFVRDADLADIGGPVWLSFVAHYAARIPPSQTQAYLDALASSGNPTLAAYAMLERSGIDALRLNRFRPST